MLTNWPASIWYKFFQKSFFEISYWHLDFNSYNSTKFTQTSQQKNLREIWQNLRLWKKSIRKLSSWKEILNWMILDFSVIQQKTCPGLYRLMFQSLHHTSLISRSRWEIDEIVNFRKLFTNNCAWFLAHFGTPFSNRKNETKWQGTWSMLQWPSLVHWQS